MSEPTLHGNGTSSDLAEPIDIKNPNAIVAKFLWGREPRFAELARLREEGWKRPEGDAHFVRQRERADNSQGGKAAITFFKMMCQIGDELQRATRALTPAIHSNEPMQVLDICMAPGGYTASALKYNPFARAYGISLPASQGGYKILLRPEESTIEYLDVTMLATEFGTDEVPATHPDVHSFLTTRPFLDQRFDLVFCDGQVLRGHERGEHRENQEALRLTVSQLILALQRIRSGGTMIMLLHKVERWHTVELLYHFTRFARVQLWKPHKKHATRSSFYLVAENMRPESEAAVEAVQMWKKAWRRATFGGEEDIVAPKEIADAAYVHSVLDDFGERFIELGRDIWDIQATALSNAPYMK